MLKHVHGALYRLEDVPDCTPKVVQVRSMSGGNYLRLALFYGKGCIRADIVHAESRDVAANMPYENPDNCNSVLIDADDAAWIVSRIRDIYES